MIIHRHAKRNPDTDRCAHDWWGPLDDFLQTEAGIRWMAEMEERASAHCPDAYTQRAQSVQQATDSTR